MLENLSCCPACDGPRSELMFAELQDRLFGVRGNWNLYRCSECGVAYLNPRLSPDYLGEAYVHYFTHGGAPPTTGFRARLGDCYIGGSHGRNPSSLSRCFVWLVRTFAPRRAESLDACLRTLPPKNTGHRLLDLGCGDGSYARMAQAAGWKVTGLENDPAACRAARSLGVSVVEAAFPPAPLPDGSFDVVRLHHVIEHLHDPRAALREIFRLLAPGGLAMVTTPNLGAYGLEVFGRDWRGLEPPRHLVLFTPAILNKLLRELGFAGVRLATSGNVSFYFHYSYALATGLSPTSDLPAEVETKLHQATEIADPNRSEAFTICAWKPGRDPAEVLCY